MSGKQLGTVNGRDLIERNIKAHGYHIYVVSGSSTPRWAYTIGLSPKIGFELVLAGAALLEKEQVLQVLREPAVISDRTLHEKSVKNLGAFRFMPVQDAWNRELLLGSNDYYQRLVPAVQIVPAGHLWTIDVPDMSVEPQVGRPSAWRWQFEPWPFAISEESEAAVDVRLLRGEPAAEASRWEEDYWEVYAGRSDRVIKEETRFLPMGALLGHDPSLQKVAELEVGTGAWRDEDGEWQPWVDRVKVTD